jgi:hypothetical protein
MESMGDRQVLAKLGCVLVLSRRDEGRCENPESRSKRREPEARSGLSAEEPELVKWVKLRRLPAVPPLGF